MPSKPAFQRAVAAVFAVLCLIVMLAAPLRAQKIVISQVYGGGGNSGATFKNDFIELFNAGSADQDLTGWSVQYASSAGSSWTNKTTLSGTIKPGQYLLIKEASNAAVGADLPAADVTGSINLSGTAGKVALVNNATSLTGTCPTGVIDFVGFGSAANCFEGTGPTGTLSNITAAVRNGGGCTDTDNNAADFTVATPTPRNTASTKNVCGGTTNPSGVGAASPASVGANSPVLLTVTVTKGGNPPSTGLSVTGDLTVIGGSAAQPFYNDGSNGDVNAGDLVFSFLTTVPDTIVDGVKNIPITITDAESRTGGGNIQLTVTPPPAVVLPIHAIQGAGQLSPYNGQWVSTTGIVTLVKSNGFFIQTPDTAKDSDLNTSEGVFVYAAPPAAAAVGNLVQVVGKVQEYVPTGYPSELAVTEISGAVSTTLVSTGNALPAPVALNLGTPPLRTNLEGVESMLVNLGTVTSVGPTGGSTTSDGTFYAVLSGTARPFRELGMVAAAIPAGMACGVAPADACIPVFDDNQERFAVDTSRLASPLEITSNTTVSGVTGVLDSSTFTFLVPAGTALNVGSGMTSAAVSVPGAREFTVATFNMLNFTADRIPKAAGVIRDLLHLPDILGVEEMKDGATLQLLADAINAGTPSSSYVTYIGSLGGSQRVGFLVNTARVQVTDETEIAASEKFYGPTSSNPNVSAWQFMFDRAPLVLHATVTPPVGQPYAVTVIVNHLRSFIDIEKSTANGPFVRAKRQACADYLATYINGLQLAGERVVTIGDFNAYQFNDGYVDVVGTMMGTPATAGQALVISPDQIDPNLVDLVNTVDADKRYSYVEDGNAQAIDHIVVTSSLLPARLEYARVDADFPSSYLNRAGRTERVSDHDPAVAYFNFPPPQADMAATLAVDSTTVTSGQGQSYTITLTNHGPDPASNPSFSDTIPAGTTFQSLTAPAGWTCTAPSIGGVGTLSCTASTLAADASAQFTLNVAVNCAMSDGVTVSNTVTAQNDYDDSITGNNSATASFGISNPAPVLGTLKADKSVLGPPNHKLVDVFLDYSVNDNCGTPNLVATVVSNQPVNGTGDGDTAPDWQVIDAHHVLLRAERAPTSAAGRTYTITITATDAVGNSASRALNVVVPR